MINIDYSVPNMGATMAKAKRVKEKEDKKTSQFKSRQIESGSSQNISNKVNIADISSMLFLQELDVYEEEQKDLKDFGEGALKSLKKLHAALLNGEVATNILHDLSRALSSRKEKFQNPEFASIASDIELRLSVEIAKLEA